jgi:hypothetical protein
MRGTEKAVVMVLTLTIALLVGHPSLKILLASTGFMGASPVCWIHKSKLLLGIS